MEASICGVDHLALQCYDVARSHDFYTRVLGGTLTSADAAYGAAWGHAYMLFGYRLPDGTSMALFAVDGIESPPAPGAMDDINHIALIAGSAQAIEAWKARLAGHGVAFEAVSHGGAEHLYFRDPNGHVFELTPEPKAFETPENAAMAGPIVDRWIGGERPAAGE